MSMPENYVKISFKNKVLTEILINHVDFTIIEGIIDTNGVINMNESLDRHLEPPKGREDVLSLFFLMLEKTELEMGDMYRKYKPAVLGETMEKLSSVLDSFEDVRIELQQGDTHSETTITTTRTTN